MAECYRYLKKKEKFCQEPICPIKTDSSYLKKKKTHRK